MYCEPIPRSKVCGVLLAGGQSRRMGGGDKCLRNLGGEPILARIIERVRPQVGPLIINANGAPARFEKFGLPVVPDVVEEFAGPLAGVLTGLDWAAKNARECDWVATFACDAPFLPPDLVELLAASVANDYADMACAVSNARDHPVFALWPVHLVEVLRTAVVDEGIRKVDMWTSRYLLARVEFGADPVDPFFNVNNPDDFAEAEKLLPKV